jgi:hypothetical protein
MIVHSDSTLGALLVFGVLLASFIVLFQAVSLLFSGRIRTAVKTAFTAFGLLAAYLTALIAVSLLTPRTIVNIGDSYCADIWCIGFDGVSTQPEGARTLYKLDVHIFSGANHVKTSAKGATLYLVDDRDRRFPLIPDPSVIPFDSTIEPRQSIKTSLTFRVDSDARQLFLTGDRGAPLPLWVRLYFGSDDSLFHKRTMLRVL